MADVPAPRKKKLPPLSQQGAEQNGDAVKKVKKKKKKPPTETAGDDNAAEEQKPTPRRRKTTSSAADEAEAPDDSKSKPASGEAPRKKKRTKPKTENAAAGEEQPEEQPESGRSRITGNEDMTGSKASLLTKTSTGTPKKRVKKKKKKVPTDDDNFMNGTLAAELAELGEDVVEAEPMSERRPRVPHYAANPVLRSQATDKLYVEKNAGFKWMKKDEVAQMQMKPKQSEEGQPDAKKLTTMEFGLLTFRVFKVVTLFVHGLTAGISFWQIILIYLLAFSSDLDLLVHYQPLGLPIQSLYYILLVLCCISAADRYDVASPTRDFLLKALTLQNGAISLVIYMASLILSLSLMGVEDKMYLYQNNATLWADPQMLASDISLWKSINVARGVTAILAWLVLSIFPNDDRLTTNLSNSKDMEKDLEMNAVSMA